MIKIKINVLAIQKDKLFKGQKGTYLDAVLMENRGGRDQYGNDGFVAMSTSKEEREAGTRGVIIGNWQHLGQKPAAKPQAAKPPPSKPKPEPDLDPDADDIPFN